MMFENNTMLRIAGLGFISGLRSMSGIAFLTGYLQEQPGEIKDTKLAWMASPLAVGLFALMAGGEMVADKMPGVPARTDPVPLAGRALMGALVGAGLSAARREKLLPGAALGSLAAVAGAFAGYHARRALTHQAELPDPPVALAEDTLVITAGRLLLKE